MRPPGSPDDLPLIACLCAQWCGSCRDYRAVFDSLERHFAGRARFRWVDVEDEDVLGPLDIENFPTLLVVAARRAHGETPAVHFYGPVTPQPQTAVRIVHRALLGELPAVADPQVQALAQRVAALATV